MDFLTLFGSVGTAACGGACIYAGEPTAGVLILVVAAVFSIGTLAQAEQNAAVRTERG